MCCSADAVYFKFCCWDFYKRCGCHIYGSQYIRSYIWDCMIAGIHFSYSGYFCAYGKSGISFLHNVLSIVLIRIPGAYFCLQMVCRHFISYGMCSTSGIVTISYCVCDRIYIFEEIYKKRREL